MRSRWPLILDLMILGWWVVLLAWLWFHWDLLHEQAFLYLMLSLPTGGALGGLMKPHVLFLCLGALLMLLLLLSARKQRDLRRVLIAAVGLALISWIGIGDKIPDWGTRLYLWRNGDRFAADARALLADETVHDPLEDVRTPTGELVWVDKGDPPMVAFAIRWVGVFHWSALVYDPTESLPSRCPVAVFGRWSPLGIEPLGSHWVVLTAMK